MTDVAEPQSLATAGRGCRGPLPALRAVRKLYGDQKPLQGFRCAAVQHLFPTTEALLEELAELGVDRSHSVILGKPYSAQPAVMQRLALRGWHVPLRALAPLSPLESARIALHRLFRKGLADSETRYLLLDDGGALVDALHTYYPEFASRCCAVEQTEHGIQRIQTEQRPRTGELACPVVNVAQSWAKKDLESTIIGEDIVDSTEQALEEAGLDPDSLQALNPNREAVVVGYGKVGKATAAALQRRGFSVYVFDKEDDRMREALADGCIIGCDHPDAPRDGWTSRELIEKSFDRMHRWRRASPAELARSFALRHGHLVFGATGSSALDDVAAAPLLPPGAILINGASGFNEICLQIPAHAVDVVGTSQVAAPGHVGEDGCLHVTFEGVDVTLGRSKDRLAHMARVGGGSPLIPRYPGPPKSRLILRGGGVINLQDDLPPAYAQLTRALLLGACCQAATESGRGLKPLDARVQRTAQAATEASLAPLGLSVTQPDLRPFRRAAPRGARLERQREDEALVRQMCESQWPGITDLIDKPASDWASGYVFRSAVATGGLDCAAAVSAAAGRGCGWLLAAMEPERERPRPRDPHGTHSTRTVQLWQRARRRAVVWRHRARSAGWTDAFTEPRSSVASEPPPGPAEATSKPASSLARTCVSDSPPRG